MLTDLTSRMGSASKWAELVYSRCERKNKIRTEYVGVKPAVNIQSEHSLLSIRLVFYKLTQCLSTQELLEKVYRPSAFERNHQLELSATRDATVIFTNFRLRIRKHLDYILSCITMAKRAEDVAIQGKSPWPLGHIKTANAKSE